MKLIFGSRALSRQVGSAGWSAIIDKTCDWFCSVIYRCEGAIARFVGDELLAFFGAPVAHEDDPVRAVRAALDILATVRQQATAVHQFAGGVPQFDDITLVVLIRESEESIL